MSAQARKSHLTVEGVAETNKALHKLVHDHLHEFSEIALMRSIEPARMDLIRFVQGQSGRHDSQRVSKKSGTWNRWRFLNKRHAGHSPGFTRHVVAKALSTPGYGFGHYMSSRSGGVRVWLKTWAPGIYIAELGRYRDAQYTGWQQILRIMAKYKYAITEMTKREFLILTNEKASELGIGGVS